MKSEIHSPWIMIKEDAQNPFHGVACLLKPRLFAPIPGVGELEGRKGQGKGVKQLESGFD